MATNSKLMRSADNIRILAAAMVEKAKSGHPGGAMGGADFINVLYAEFLRYDPDERTYPFRDRFFLDPGHMAPMLYATLSLAGAYTSEELQQLRQWGSPTPGHPEVDVARGVENTSGPLGQGHAMGLGAAIAERFLVARFGEWMAHRTFAYISDGGVEEEVSQGVGRIAGHLGLNNFIMYYDANNVQLSTRVDEVDTENVAMKYEAWGWNVLTIDGHDVDAIRAALTAACDERERPTLIVASADLSNSDKTDGFLKKTTAFTKGDFTGKFFQAGVSELTMACVMNGMALHGGVIPACGTFFVFSDYMKPAVRLAALMRLHVIYVWSHDSFRVGEDGPTHQPVEHEAQIRLMEHLRNHRGERSMVVLRPADGEETIAAWRYALSEHRPVALVLSRQNIKNLPTLRLSRREEAAQLQKGAYIVMDAAKPVVVMLASGSEVATLVEGAQRLVAEGINVRVVSVPSEGLFRDQPKSYQDTVLPKGIVRYGMTSGLPVTLLGLVGEQGMIHGLDHFGYSAPYKVLDEQFGYNGATVYEEVKKLLAK